MAATSATMEFSVEPAGPCRKRVKVSIPSERVSEEFDKSYRQWIRTVPIPGFRPGKAPRALVEKRFGKQVAQEVKQSLLEAALKEALAEEKIDPISDPEIDVEQIEVKPADALAFDFMVNVRPEFELPDLKQIEVTVPPADPADEEIERALRSLRKRKAVLRPLEKGTIGIEDVVSLRVRGRRGEDELFHEENRPYEVGSRLLGELVVSGLDEALVGLESGATARAQGIVPPYLEDHPLAGAELELECEVLDVKRPELPELDDEFAAGFDFESRDEMVEAVSRSVRRRLEREREKQIEDLALARLVEQADFELPDDLIQHEATEMARRATYELQMRNEPEEEIARRVAEMRDRHKDESVRELKTWFLIDKIVENERIIVTENEVREAVTQIAEYNERTPEQMYAALRDSNRLSSLRRQLREKKARALLRRRVKVNEQAAEETGGKATAKAKTTGTKKKTAAKKKAKKKTDDA